MYLYSWPGEHIKRLLSIPLHLSVQVEGFTYYVSICLKNTVLIEKIHFFKLKSIVLWFSMLACLCLVILSLYGYLKSKIYTTPPRDVDELWVRIVEEVNVDKLSGDRNTIKNAIRGFRSRAEVCVARNRGHVEGNRQGRISELSDINQCYQFITAMLCPNFGKYLLVI